MRLDQLKLIFEAGDLVAAEIVPAPMEPGPKARWIVQVKWKNGVKVALELNRKAPGGNDQVRVFNSLDAAYSAARNVGFRAVRVQE